MSTDLNHTSDKITIHEQLPTAQVALYLHLPFCRTRCAYCTFNTYVGLTDLIEPYIQAVIHEMRMVAPEPPYRAASVYMGGGTPSLLPAHQVDLLLHACRTFFALTPDAEITLEVNPGTISPTALAQLRTCGINRLSIGMQSAHTSELRLFGRTHTVIDVQTTVAHARHAGFDNISLDLIYGIPHQTPEHWHASLDAALALNPEHISLYSLSIEDATPLYRRIAENRLPAPDPDLAADMYELARTQLAAAGFTHYEISNWAKPGYACRHNVHVWRNLPYLGFGAGAHGYAAHTRYANVNHPTDYIARITTRPARQLFPLSAAAQEVIQLDQHNVISETLILGLRLVQEGITGPDYAARFGHDLFARYGRPIEQLCAHGLLEHDAPTQRIRLTQRGHLLANQVFAEFI